MMDDLSAMWMSPGEQWPRFEVDALEDRVDEGRAGVNVVALDGPLEGERLFLPHIEWVLYLVPEDESRTSCNAIAHPPGYILDTNGWEHKPIGVYVYDAANEGLRFASLTVRPTTPES